MPHSQINDLHDRRLGSRQIDEFIGICRGLIAKGGLQTSDIKFVRDWFDDNMRIADAPLVDEIFDRIEEVLEDGDVDPDEAEELFETFRALVGGRGLGQRQGPMALQFDKVEEVTFDNRRFCFTGVFDKSSRSECEGTVRDFGGHVDKNMTTKTDYLVVGSHATESWKHASFGTKIMDALRWRYEHGIVIIDEQQWNDAVWRHLMEQDVRNPKSDSEHHQPPKPSSKKSDTDHRQTSKNSRTKGDYSQVSGRRRSNFGNQRTRGSTFEERSSWLNSVATPQPWYFWPLLAFGLFYITFAILVIVQSPV